MGDEYVSVEHLFLCTDLKYPSPGDEGDLRGIWHYQRTLSAGTFHRAWAISV